MAEDLKKAYRTIEEDHFAPRMRIVFDGPDGATQEMVFEKVTWDIDGVRKGLRYGDNPGQEAAMYRAVGGNLRIGQVELLPSGRGAVTDTELLLSGKHPGKINLTDVDSALNILRFFPDEPCVVIIKHNNPCGVAKGATIEEAYLKAYQADPLAAFGGCIALNRVCTRATAEAILRQYAEVVVAPEFEGGAMEVFATKKNLRVMRIKAIDRLHDYADQRVLELKSLMDGGIIAQVGYLPRVRRVEDFITPEVAGPDGTVHRIARMPTKQELDDLLFGWLVEGGVTSNSVLFVKDGVTVGIGAGEQDRVGVAEIARDKAYRKLADRYARDTFQTPYNELDDAGKRTACDAFAAETNGGLKGACMVSDAFFPFRDGVEVGIREGIAAVVQPGGSVRDWDVIDCCNTHGVAMVFTGQRCFRH